MIGRFSNPWGHEEHGLGGVLKWKLGFGEKSEKSDAPDLPPECVVGMPGEVPSEGWRVTWLGHASFLIQGCGRNLLIDPIFSDYCAPMKVPGLRRVARLPFGIGDLPKIDAVLLTHSHYDHLDLPTLGMLGNEIELVISEGHAAWLRRKGFRKVRELPWFGSDELLPGIRVTATPAQHFTARSPFDRNVGHWCGWRIDGGGSALWHAGDSGYCPAFRETADRLGPVDFGMIPIGAYSSRWFMKPMHMTPEEAVEAYVEARCRQAVAMHWGTFRLTDEPLGEPPLRLAAELERRGLAGDAFVAGMVGESWNVTVR